MAIDIFDMKSYIDFQLIYFSELVDTSIEFYRLDEIVYNKLSIKNVEW